MKKKIAVIGLCIALIVVALAGGTLAYFTDTDTADNVMTTGRIGITQNEQKRGADGATLEDFTDDVILMPVTNYEKCEKVTVNGKEYDMFSNKVNFVDKIVTVTNEKDSEEAYVRTLFAFEMIKQENDDGSVTWIDPIDAFDTKALWTHWIGGDVVADSSCLWPLNTADGSGVAPYPSGKDCCHVEINGVMYVVAEYYYGNGSKLAPGETSHPSLMQVAFEGPVTNEQAAALVGEDGKYSILVLSQAVQTAGFTDERNEDGSVKTPAAEVALNAAFGDVSQADKETLQKWFSECK